MKIAISQPTYLPWLGYFDLMDQVDAFVLLDTVQFEKQSWQQRNRIKTPTGLQWLTVPVAFRGRFGQQIRDVEIRDSSFAQKHLRAVEVSYGRAPFFSDVFTALSSILRKGASSLRLVKLNVELLEWLMEILGICKPVVLASSLLAEGRRTQLLAHICDKLGATQYLSPIGAAGYLLKELHILSANNIETSFHNYEHPQYKQLFPPFLPFASTIDLILNEGEQAMQIIRSGRRTPFTPEEIAEGTVQAKQP